MKNDRSLNGVFEIAEMMGIYSKMHRRKTYALMYKSEIAWGDVESFNLCTFTRNKR